MSKQQTKKLKDIKEFTLSSDRFFYFQSRQFFFVTNGNKKDEEHQETDYAVALECLEEFRNDPDTKRFRESNEDRSQRQ